MKKPDKSIKPKIGATIKIETKLYVPRDHDIQLDVQVYMSIFDI